MNFFKKGQEFGQSVIYFRSGTKGLPPIGITFTYVHAHKAILDALNNIGYFSGRKESIPVIPTVENQQHSLLIRIFLILI